MALRGNVCVTSLARWKAHSRFPVGYNWTFFDSSYGWGTRSENTSKSAFVEEMGHFEAKYYVEWLRLPPTSIHCSIWDWFYYTSFPMGVFTQRNFVAEFIRFKLILINKNDSSYSWNVISVISRRFSKRGRSLWPQILGGRRRRPPTSIGIRKL